MKLMGGLVCASVCVGRIWAPGMKIHSYMYVNRPMLFLKALLQNIAKGIVTLRNALKVRGMIKLGFMVSPFE